MTVIRTTYTYIQDGTENGGDTIWGTANRFADNMFASGNDIHIGRYQISACSLVLVYC